jgi:tetratricopeptide (TPR) repeat protein
MTFTSDQFRRILDLCAPLMQTVSERRGQVSLAFGHPPFLNRITWEGDTRTFLANLIGLLLELHRYEDKHPLQGLLESVREQVGADKQAQIDALLPLVAALPPDAQMPARAISVFLSYARADDDPNYDDPAKSFMRRLYNDLKTAGFRVWWDRESLPSRGETFTHEIEMAIRQVERFVLVVGPGAVTSDYVPKEWECALENCLPVTPILRSGDYSLIPTELRDVNAIDFREPRAYADALKDLINRLGESSEIGKLVNVPPLPEAFVLREKPFKAAQEAIRADSINPVIVSAPPRAVAVYGYGGIGKSTLAAALAANCDIRRRYTDGVIWLPIGQEPNIVSRQIDLGLLFGDSREYYPDPESGKIRLSWLLVTRHVKALLVLDDVWDHRVVENFPVNGTASRVLLTTRSPQIADLVQGADVRLDLLTPEEGAALIAKRIGGDPNNEASQAISSELGGLTLAITLAAAQIARHHADSPADMLRLLKKAGGSDSPFQGLAVHKTDKDLNLEKSLELSYQSLSPDERRRFRELGVLALDAPFDRALSAAVWGDADEDAAREPLTIFESVGLIENIGLGIYTIHRILRVYAHALLLRDGALDAVFARYADKVIVLAEGFHTLPPERWSELALIVPHVHAVGDELARQLPGLGADPADENRWKRMLALASNITRYLAKRREVRHFDWLEMGLAASRTLNNQARESLFLNTIGSAWAALGEQRKALDFYEQALPLCKAVGNRHDEATTLANIGSAWAALGEQRKALDFCEQALPLHKAVGNRDGEATTLNLFGHAWSALGEQRKALDFYEQALLLHQAVGNRDGEATAFNNVGSAWDALGEKRKALDFYEQALLLSKAVGNQGGEATALNNIGLAWDTLGEKRKALGFYEQALPLYKMVGDRRGEATALYNIGGVWYVLEERKALDFYDQALPLYQAVGDRGGEGYTLHNIALIYEAEGDLDKALACETRSVELLDAVEDMNAGTVRQNLERLQLKHSRQLETPSNLPTKTVNALASNTVAVKTNVPDKLSEWRARLKSIRDNFASDGWQNEIAFADALLAVLKDQPASLPDYNLYQSVLRQVIDGITQYRMHTSSAVPSGSGDDGKSGSSLAKSLTDDQINILSDNTEAAKTDMPETLDEWKQELRGFRDDLATKGTVFHAEVAFADALLAVLDDQPASLPDDNPYQSALQQVIAVIAAHHLGA